MTETIKPLHLTLNQTKLTFIMSICSGIGKNKFDLKHHLRIHLNLIGGICGNFEGSPCPTFCKYVE